MNTPRWFWLMSILIALAVIAYGDYVDRQHTLERHTAWVRIPIFTQDKWPNDKNGLKGEWFNDTLLGWPKKHLGAKIEGFYRVVGDKDERLIIVWREKESLCPMGCNVHR